jgi:hypothetical protein
MTGRTQQLRSALRTAASSLKEYGPEFALAGSYALWVYGGPEPTHDVDVVVAEVDVEAAAHTLAKAGFDIERPVEDWLFKARTDDVVVDVLHRLNGVPVDGAVLSSAHEESVLALRIPVLPPTRVVIQKLRALDEHYCDFTLLLPAVRAVRERVDWPAVRAETADNDYAVAFMLLAERLGLTER